MSLSFNPQTEEEILDLLPEGEYDFLVKEAENYISKMSGNESIKLTIEVYGVNSNPKDIYCYLSPNYKLLFKHFFDATGLRDVYKSGSITPEICVNQSGRCTVIREYPQMGSNYAPKNIIKDFLKRDPSNPAAATPMAPLKAGTNSDGFDSDIPF